MSKWFLVWFVSICGFTWYIRDVLHVTEEQYWVTFLFITLISISAINDGYSRINNEFFR